MSAYMELDSRKFLVMDVDGTLFDRFREIDKHIIRNVLFSRNIFVKILDKILWQINSLDLFSNPMKILETRLRTYAILSGNKFNVIRDIYSETYQYCLEIELNKKREILGELEKTYNILFITSNMYALKSLVVCFDYQIAYAPDLKTRRKKIFFEGINNIECIVGNNYTDDICTARRNNISSIYVGKSILKRFFKANYIVSSFDEASKVLLK